MDEIARDIARITEIPAVQRILEVVCQATGLGFAVLARVTSDRWVACAVRDEISFGLEPGGELPILTTFCHQVHGTGEAVVIDNVQLDPLYREHEIPKMYGFESYISVPVKRRNGEFFGTLCAIDPRPASVDTAETRNMFSLFGELIAFHLEAEERVTTAEGALDDERSRAALREQFVAVLGHDLRNPLGAIAAGAMALRGGADEDTPRIAALIERSTDRMAEIISNVLDFARGQLGEGLTIRRTADADLESALSQVVGELREATDDGAIESVIRLEQPVLCDSARIAQMFSNLLANALNHGDGSRAVSVEARSDEEAFELSVTNAGPVIAAESIPKLFLPYSRGASSGAGEGLGLGLYIANQIALAHGGELTVTSRDNETRFTFRMPPG